MMMSRFKKTTKHEKSLDVKQGVPRSKKEREKKRWNIPKRYIYKETKRENHDGLYSYTKQGKFYLGMYESENEKHLPEETDNKCVRVYFEVQNNIPPIIMKFIEFEDMYTRLEEQWDVNPKARGNQSAEMRFMVDDYTDDDHVEKIMFMVDFIGTDRPTAKDIKSAKEFLSSELGYRLDRVMKARGLHWDWWD